MVIYREPIEAAGYHVDIGDSAFSTIDLREPDLVFMMGGPMGVYEQDHDAHCWLAFCHKREVEPDRQWTRLEHYPP